MIQTNHVSIAKVKIKSTLYYTYIGIFSKDGSAQ